MHSHPPFAHSAPGEACISLAGRLICFAGCIICQDVMSSRPWKQLWCGQSAGTRGRVCESSWAFLRGQHTGATNLATCCQSLTLTRLPSKGAQGPPAVHPSGLRGRSSRLQQNCIASQCETIWAETGQNLTRVQFLPDDYLLAVCTASLLWAPWLPPAAHRLPLDTTHGPALPGHLASVPCDSRSDTVLISPTGIHRLVYTSAYLLPPPSGAEGSTMSSPQLPQTSKWHHSASGDSGRKPRSQS